MVNKIPAELDGPIDNLIYRHIDYTLPFYKKLGLTPNLITTISLILGLLSVYFTHIDYYTLGAILWVVSYYYDCADGKMARKYKMTSKFGDKYDHIADMIKTVLLTVVLYNKLKTKSMNTIIIIVSILSVFILGSCAHMGCTEEITKEEKSDSLSVCKLLIFGDCYKQMKITRYFTTGSLTIVIAAIIYLLSEL
jgi:phosphatidylglycerophosphate synthase